MTTKTPLDTPDPDDHRPVDGTADVTHFEVELDSEPQPGGGPVDRSGDVYMESTSDGRRPVIPSSLRGWANVRSTLRYAAGRTAHIIGYHAVRSPWYAVQACWWAIVGVFRLIGRQLRWWWVAEQHELRQRVADQDDPMAWLRLHEEVKRTRLWRGIVLAGQVIALLIGGPLVWSAAPWWALVLVVMLVVVLLARLGRPADRPIVTTAMVTGRYRRLNADIVLRAYYAAGLGHPDKPNQQVTFGLTMARDASGTGSQVVIDLPYGKGFDDAVKAKGAIASGLDVSINQVFLTRDPSSHRRHVLFVADRDPLAIPAGKSPLLDGKIRDIWKPAPFGLDERGRKVTLALMWISILVGAQPRKGKTFSARLLALYAALDPYVRLIVVDGKITPELARRYPELRAWLLVMEEFQVYFELDDQDTNKEIAGLLSFIMAVGPSAGVIILSSSQKPSGVGAGDVTRLFNRYRDNHAVRFALKCGNRTVSEAVLGGDAYAEGFDASALPAGKRFRGVGILYGASDDTPIVRTYLADHTDAEKILLAARKHRQAAGTLSGLAAGEDLDREVRDVLADARAMFNPGDKGLQWEELAARLADRIPEHYADITAEAISAQLRALRIRSVDVKRAGAARKGCRAEDLDATLNARSAGGSVTA